MLLTFSVTLLVCPILRWVAVMFRMFSSRLPFRRSFPVARFSWTVVYCLIIFNEKKIGELRCYRSRSRSRYSNSKPKDRKSSRCSHCCQRTATSSNQPCAPHGGALLCCFFILSCFFAAINGSTWYGRAAYGGVELVRPLFE